MSDIAGEYVFKPNNPFMSDLHSFAKAKSLFRHGVLSEAVYALEAEVCHLTCPSRYCYLNLQSGVAQVILKCVVLVIWTVALNGI